MAKPLRNLFILLLVIVLLGAGAWWLLRTPQRAVEAEAGALAQRKMADVTSVTVQNAHGAYTVTQTPEGITVGDLPPELINVEYVAMLLDECSSVQYTALVDEAAPDLSLYGLAAPEATVDIAYADGTALQLLLGAQETISDARYFTVRGTADAKAPERPAVYLMKAGRTVRFTWPVSKFIPYVIIPPNESTSILSAVQDITFSGTQLSAPIALKAVLEDRAELRRTALSFGAVSHLMVEPALHETNQTELLRLVESLCGLISEGVVDYNCTPPQLAAYGFDTPALRVEFDYKNGSNAEVVPYDLRLVKQDGTYLATLGDTGVVYKIAAVDFTTVRYENLVLRWFFSPFLTEVQKLVVDFGTQSYTFDFEGEAAKDLTVHCNGKVIDSEQMRKYYNLVVSAAAEERAPASGVQQGAMLATVRYGYKDVQKPDDVLRVYAGSARRALVEVNGTVEYTMRETYVQCLQKATENLANGQSFSVEW